MKEDVIYLRVGDNLDADTILGLRGTKPFMFVYLSCSSKTWEKYYNKEDFEFEDIQLSDNDEVTNWSNVIKLGIDYLQPHIRTCVALSSDKVFINTYNECLDSILSTQGIKPNGNFIKRLFKKEEESLITSTVYKSNANHCIKVLTDLDNISWYACAVFTGEIIWVLEALINTIDVIYKKYLPSDKYECQPIPAFDIRYTIKDLADKEGDEQEVVTVDNNINEDLANDLVTLFLNASILQMKAPTEMKEDLDLMKSKYVEIAGKNDIDLVGIMKDMIS